MALEVRLVLRECGGLGFRVICLRGPTAETAQAPSDSTTKASIYNLALPPPSVWVIPTFTPNGAVHSPGSRGSDVGLQVAISTEQVPWMHCCTISLPNEEALNPEPFGVRLGFGIRLRSPGDARRRTCRGV